MTLLNALELPGVSFRLEYRTWSAAIGEWRTWDQGASDSIPWPGVEPYIEDGKLIVNNNQLPSQDAYSYQWWFFRVFLDGLPLPYAPVITAQMTDATVYGSQIEVGGNYDTRFDVYGNNEPTTGTGVVDTEGAPAMSFLGGYDSGAIVGSILIQVEAKAPFWTDHVLTTELVGEASQPTPPGPEPEPEPEPEVPPEPGAVGRQRIKLVAGADGDYVGYGVSGYGAVTPGVLYVLGVAHTIRYLDWAPSQGLYLELDGYDGPSSFLIEFPDWSLTLPPGSYGEPLPDGAVITAGQTYTVYITS